LLTTVASIPAPYLEKGSIDLDPQRQGEEPLLEPEQDPVDVGRRELGLARVDRPDRERVPASAVVEEDPVTAVSPPQGRHRRLRGGSRATRRQSDGPDSIKMVPGGVARKRKGSRLVAITPYLTVPKRGLEPPRAWLAP
jgi:hypothetical protein